MVSLSSQLRNKANDFLNSKRNANNLADILQMFETETDNFTPLLLTIELIFTELLRRGELIEQVVPLKTEDVSPEAKYTKWLCECYEAALKYVLGCIKNGQMSSRLQALVTACKLMQAEGCHPLEDMPGYHFPAARLKNIFTMLLDSDVSMSAPITRFQEFSEYRDVQQYGLKILPTLAYRKSPTPTYMQNYLELVDKLLTADISTDAKKPKSSDDDYNEKQLKVLCKIEGRPTFSPNFAACRRYANRCWGFACRWALRSEPRTLRRALLLLVERLMPILARPQLATDLLCDSLDAGGPISMLALQGVLELMRRHHVEYPAVYDRLYAMFEPEMFATRHKARLLHLADIFLSSTHLPESLVAAFVKRLCRLALVAGSEEASALLTLVGMLLRRHPALKRMLDHRAAPPLMSADPYVMEETCAAASRALGSSLWELPALQRSAAPAVAAAAAALRAGELPPEPTPQNFDSELKRRFKTIEMNFIRPQGASLPSGERLLHYWDVMG